MLTFEDLLKRSSASGAIDLQAIEESPAVGYNAGKCDVLLGFCSCGAHHKPEEIPERKLTPYGKQLANSMGFQLKEAPEEVAPAPIPIQKLPNRRAAIEATKEKIQENKEY